MRSWSRPTESTCRLDCSCEVEAFCGRERSGSPQPKSRALARDLESWRALRDSKLRRFAARSTSSRCSFAQGRLKAEPRTEILSAAKDRCFAGMSVPEKRRSSCDASPTSCDLCIEGKTWLCSPSPDENKELLGFVSQINLPIRHWGCFLPARLDPLQLGDRVVQHSVYHGFEPHLVFESL